MGKPLQPLDDKYKSMLLALNPREMTTKDIQILFGRRYDAKAKKIIEPIIPRNTYFTLKAGEYINKKDVTTTPGVFLYNKCLVEDNLEAIVPDGYYNPKEITNKVHDKLRKLLFPALMQEIITLDNVKDYLTREENWGLLLVPIFSPSFTESMVFPNPIVQKKKAEMIKAARASKDKLTLSDMVKIEDDLIEFNAKLLDDDIGMHLYKSGSRGSFDNDFKLNNIMVGPVLDPATGGYNMVESSYTEGVKKSELAAAANGIINGQYPKSVGTQVGGYKTKQFYAVFQSIVAGEHGSDCGTHGYREILITEDNYKDYLYDYIFDDNFNSILLTDSNVKNYFGKVVKKRSPLYCLYNHNDQFCNKCFGERLYKMNMLNVGPASVAISNGLLNKSMKKNHVSKVSFNKVNIDSLII